MDYCYSGTERLWYGNLIWRICHKTKVWRWSAFLFDRSKYTWEVEVLLSFLSLISILIALLPFLNGTKNTKNMEFCTFLLLAVTYWDDILYMTLFWPILSVINLHQFLYELCLFGNLEYLFYALLLYMLQHMKLKLCIWLCFMNATSSTKQIWYSKCVLFFKLAALVVPVSTVVHAAMVPADGTFTCSCSGSYYGSTCADCKWC